jgi:flagellar hook-length control protein FliK
LPAEAPAPAEPASPVEDPPPAEPALPVEAPVQVETSDAGVSSVASSVFEGSHTESTGAAAQSLPPAPVPSNPASTPRQPRATSPVPLPPASAPDAPPRDTPVALPAVRTNVPEAPTPAAQAHTPSPGPRGRTSSPDPAPAQSIDAVASIESQAAVVSLDAKPLTTVVIPSAAASPPVSGLARTQAIDTMISAANHAVIQRASSGSIEVPELGRIAVRATSAGGSVDIDVAAARPETRAVLHASTPALTFDLQQAHISVRQLRLDSDGSSSAAWSGPGRQSAPEDMPRGREPHDSDADDPPPEIAPVGSVRIVL